MATAAPAYTVTLHHLAPGALAAGLAYPDEQLSAMPLPQLRELLYAFTELAAQLTIYEPSLPEIRIKTDRESFTIRTRYRKLWFVGYETALRGEEHSVAYILTTITGTAETAKAPEPRPDRASLASATTTSTRYFATFQVESGDRMELSVSGSEYGMLAEGEKVQLGRAYPEALTVRNSGSIDEYVRVAVSCYWVDAAGNKMPALSPRLIGLHLLTGGNGWTEDAAAATPEETGRFPRWLKIAVMAVIIIGCNAGAAWMLLTPPKTIAPKFSLMTPAESVALLGRVAGEYRTGSQEGDRRLIIDPTGTARLAKFGPNQAVTQPTTKTIRGAIVDGKPALITGDPAAITLKDADTLILFGNTYKRHNP